MPISTALIRECYTTMVQANDATMASGRPGGPRHGRGDRRKTWPLVLVLAWAALAIAEIALVNVGSGSHHPSAETNSASGLAVHKSGHLAPTKEPSVPVAVTPHFLAPLSAAAFGPSGIASGDNPQSAAKAIDTSATTAWTTNWYRSAHFGGLQAGTGLLIDMGRLAKVTSVRIELGAARGADLEVLTGNTAALTAMHVTASAADIGGTVDLTIASPGPARYLVIWFTLLPPDSSGTFQVSVYNVTLEGTG